MSDLTPERVLEALRGVDDPELGRSLVELDMIRDLSVDAKTGHVTFTVVLTTPACPLRTKIEEDCTAAVQAVDGVSGVTVKMDARVRGGNTDEDPIEGVQHIVLVMSGKGGVGKSTVAVNLALALAKAGARVGLLDADVHGPSLPTILGANETPRATPAGRILPPRAHGVPYLSVGLFLEQDGQAVIWRGPMLSSLLRQFLTEVEWGELDYLVCDLPPGTGDAALTLVHTVKVTGALIVTTPQAVAIADVRKAVDMCRAVEVPVIGVVENMSYFVCDSCGKRHELFGAGGGAAVAELAGAPLLGQIAMDPGIRVEGDEGSPTVVVAPESERGKSLIAMAEAVAARIASTGLKRTAGGPPPERPNAQGAGCGHH